MVQTCSAHPQCYRQYAGNKHSELAFSVALADTTGSGMHFYASGHFVSLFCYC